MSFTNQTTHYGLPQWIGSDKPTYLVDQNNAYQTIDAEIYNANTTAGAAQTAAEGAVQTAGAASTTASDALTAAQTASSTADNALTEAQTANTNAQAAQTAAGAAQTAAQAAQEAAAGNSITNLAPAYDPTITYKVGALVTADGKLYQCIVAVTSPEQFDINKWDDKTTSEVFASLQGEIMYSNNAITVNSASGLNPITTYQSTRIKNDFAHLDWTVSVTVPSDGLYTIASTNVLPAYSVAMVANVSNNIGEVTIGINGDIRANLKTTDTFITVHQIYEIM